MEKLIIDLRSSELALDYREENYPEERLIAGCLDVSILYDAIVYAYKAGYKKAVEHYEQTN